MKKLLLTTAITMSLAGFAGTAMAEHHERDGKGHKGKHGKMFKKMDADDNGVITKDEARAFHEKRFDKMDANGDGEISKDEAMAYKKARHDKHKGRHDED